MTILAILLLAGCTGGEVPSATSSSFSSVRPENPESASAQAEATAAASLPAVSLRIHVNQTGYFPHGSKLAIMASDHAFNAETIRMIRESDGKTVWSAEVPAGASDRNSGDWVSQADFSAVQDDGVYHLEVQGARSPSFRIGTDVYGQAFRAVARSYTLQRSGVALKDTDTGLELPAGHLQDQEATLFFQDDRNRKDTMDVAGGWYDAGDYGKYIPTAAISAAQLLLAFELRPDFFAAHSFLQKNEKIDWKPEQAAPDLLYEVKFELDWMGKMQRSDGAVYLKVAGKAFPGFITPAEDVEDRYVYGLSSYGTAQYSGVMALGARLYQPYDSKYAALLLKRAQLAQVWLDAHPEPLFREDEGQNAGSGGYEKQSDREERFWALAELVKTTEISSYASKLTADYEDLIRRAPAGISWNDAALLGQWATATAEELPKETVAAALQGIQMGAKQVSEQIGLDGYRSALAADDYHWASNKVALAKGMVLLLANQLASSSEYVADAADQLHYVLGRNAMGMSYVTGIGTKYPLHPHHRISASTGIEVPGLLVGGPNRNGEDEVLAQVVSQGAPPAKSYIDDLGSYASNEYAIDYNAPLFFLLSILQDG